MSKRKRKSIEFRTLQNWCAGVTNAYPLTGKLLYCGYVKKAPRLCAADDCPIWHRLPDVEPVRVTVQSRKGETVFEV